MSSITINIDDEKKNLLLEAAKLRNQSLEELIQQAIDAYLKEKNYRFEDARSYVRDRYAKLYKRLA
jgi:predicted transcriptional regulator